MGRPLIWALMVLTLLAVSLHDTQVRAEVGPSESECRPYIEKALNELKSVDSGADDKESEETDTPDTGPSIEKEDEADDDDDGDSVENVGGEMESAEDTTQQATATDTGDDNDTAEETKEDDDTKEDASPEMATQEANDDDADDDDDSKEKYTAEESVENVETGDDKSEEEKTDDNKSGEEDDQSEEDDNEAKSATATDDDGDDNDDDEQKSDEDTEEQVDERTNATEEDNDKSQEDGTQEEDDDDDDDDDDEKSGEKTKVDEASDETTEGDQNDDSNEQKSKEEEKDDDDASKEASDVAKSAEEDDDDDDKEKDDTAEESAEAVGDGNKSEEDDDNKTEEKDDETDSKEVEKSDEDKDSGEVDEEEAVKKSEEVLSRGRRSVVDDGDDDDSKENGDDDSKENADDAASEEEKQADESDEQKESAEDEKDGSKEEDTAKSVEDDDDDDDDDKADDSKEAAADDDSKEADASKEATDNDDDSKETTNDGDNDDEDSKEKTAEESEEKDDGVNEESKEDDTRPEDDLLLEHGIPTNLRNRDHIAELLHLDDESVEKETAVGKVADIILRDLKRIYENAIKPLETLYKYRDLSNRHFGDPEIFSKPLVLFMGPWSGGKSTLINYLTGIEYTEHALRTGAEPSPAYFNILMYGEKPEVLDGTQLAADWTFSGLQKFGQGLEDRLRGLKLPNKLLEKVNIVEIPGILEVRKQVSRLFPFNDACQWFIDRADIIFLVYDPTKLDVGPETEAILDQLKGREYQTRIILNKADHVMPEELMRVQSALIWNISPLMSSAQPPIMYTTSLWSHPYEVGAPIRLLQAQERALLRDLRGAVDKRIENKIASARRFAVRVRNHAKMVDCYLTTYYNHKSLFGNRKQIADQIIDNPQNYHIYEGLSTLTNISRYDLPDPEVYRDFFRLNPLYEFKKLSETCTYFRGCPINKLDVAIAYDLPELVGKYKKSLEVALHELETKNADAESSNGKS